MPRYSKKKKKSSFVPRTKAKSPTKRPAKRMQWTRMQMEAAIKAVETGSAVSINRVAKEHGIPPTTLKDRISGRVVDGTKPGRSSYLTDDEEVELESYLVKSCQLGYGKTRRQVKSIVEKVALDKGLLRKSHISDGWWKAFRSRHPKLSLRSGDATGHARIKATNRQTLTHYFDLLNDILEEFNFKDHPERVYNMDEHGGTSQSEATKVLATKAKRKSGTGVLKVEPRYCPGLL